MFYLMVEDLRLQLLNVTAGDRAVLNDPMCFLDLALQVLHFLFILLVLNHSLLDKKCYYFWFVTVTAAQTNTTFV